MGSGASAAFAHFVITCGLPQKEIHKPIVEPAVIESDSVRFSTKIPCSEGHERGAAGHD
jgi:hypothetical protein